jgi:hypothetical protein
MRQAAHLAPLGPDSIAAEQAVRTAAVDARGGGGDEGVR